MNALGSATDSPSAVCCKNLIYSISTTRISISFQLAEKSSSSSTTIFILLFIGIILIVGAIVGYIIIKKKKQTTDDTISEGDRGTSEGRPSFTSSVKSMVE
jgi:hypothetical protein